jgi:hypothetical protein
MRLIDRHTTEHRAAVLKAVLAGAAGTAAMTAHQQLRQRLGQHETEPEEGKDHPADEQADPWESAPAPAQVGRRLIEGALGRSVSPRAIPALTQVMHWSYGSMWGSVYAIARESVRARGPLLGPLFGLGVWTASYVQLVPLGIYEPPWTYPVKAVRDEIGYHVTYGSTVAVTYGMMARPAMRSGTSRRSSHPT